MRRETPLHPPPPRFSPHTRQSIVQAPAGAGTPVPPGVGGPGKGRATVAVSGGGGEEEGKAVAGWENDDFEAQQVKTDGTTLLFGPAGGPVG